MGARRSRIDAPAPTTGRRTAQVLMREALLDLAAERVVTVGWRATTMSDLAVQGGVSRQSVHNHFGTKEDLASALVEREVRRLADRLVVEIQQATGLRAALTTGLTLALDLVSDVPFLRRMFSDLVAGQDSSMIWSIVVRADRFIGPLRRVLEAEVGARWELPEHLIRLSLDLCVRLVFSELMQPGDVPPETAVAFLADLIAGFDNTADRRVDEIS